MVLAAGARLGPYEIQSPLGAGGMGEVYKARDTRLDRTVAIKVLPADKTADPERKRRFMQEARAASALNDPNIVTLHDIANDSGTDYLVMEYVPGKSLDKLITPKGLPLVEVIAYATQIARALAAAHAAKIVHRDIKPANVIVTPEGHVKVLDFGLAKLTERDPGPDADTVTQESALTEDGRVMGTVAYMSPEQASARPLDHRTDVFSLGVLTYEMAAGENPFKRRSPVETLHAIIHDPVPPLELVPSSLAEILEKTLEKDPRERYQDAGDLAIDLRRTQRNLNRSSASRSGPIRAVGHGRWVAWTIAGIAGVAVAALASVAMWPREQASLRDPLTFAFEPPDGVTLVREGQSDAAVSPDGRRVAFVGQPTSGPTAIWVRALGLQESQRIEGTDGAAGPFWSADGQFLGFFAQGKLKKMALERGLPQNICTTTPGLGATWSPSGEIVFNPTNRAPLMRVSASGGAPQELTTLDSSRHENSHRWPSFLPDGRHFLFTARANEKENTAIYVGSLDSNATKRLLTEQSNAVYAAPGYLLFGREGTLMAQRFDPNKLELSGEAFPVVGNIDQETPSATAFFSVSRDGSVLTFHEASRSLDELSWFDREGKRQGTVGPKGLYGWPRLSPDGNRVAVWIPDPESGNRDIWIIDVASGARTRFTSNPANDWFPEWSPDGAYVTFASDRTSPPNLYRKAASGDGEEVLVPRDASSSWLPGGITAPPFAEGTGGSYSRNGNWVAYQSTKSGTLEIYVRSLDRPEEHRISTMGGAHPRWRRDGKELFYVTPDNSMMTAGVSLGERFASAPPVLLFHVCNARRSDAIATDYEVTPDGNRFLFSCQSQEVRKRSISVAIRWLDMVKRPAQQ